MRASHAILWAALLAGCEGEPQQRVAGMGDDPNAERSFTADHTVEELLAEEAPTAEGALLCADVAGWTVYGWRVPMNNRRDVRGLPIGAPEVSAPVAEDGSYTLALPSGPRRFVAAVQDETGRIAWSDKHARTFPFRQPLVGLSLDCDLRPTPATDGSTVVAQGEHLGSGDDHESAINSKPLELTAIGSTPAGVHERAVDDVKAGSKAHEALLRRRYQDDVSEEELTMLMPLLMQFSDDPVAADRLVGRMKRVKHHRKNEPSRPRDQAPTGLIEMPHSHSHARGGR